MAIEFDDAKLHFNLSLIKSASIVAAAADPSQDGAEHFIMALAVFVGTLAGKMSPGQEDSFMEIIKVSSREIRSKDARQDTEATRIADELMRMARGS